MEMIIITFLILIVIVYYYFFISEGTLNLQLGRVSYDEMISNFSWTIHGGFYMPTECKPRESVAIIIPFRDREEHLRILLNNLHPVLYRQQLAYTIYIVEQVCTLTFLGIIIA